MNKIMNYITEKESRKRTTITWGQNRKFWRIEDCRKDLALRTWTVWHERQELALEGRDKEFCFQQVRF